MSVIVTDSKDRTTIIFEAQMQSRISIKDYLLFSEAWLFLARARVMLLFRPFNKIVPVLKDGKVENAAADIALLQLVKLSIARAAIRSPWRTKCFEQALAARMMLRRRGIPTTTFFGVLKNASNNIEAHAWLKSGDFVVTGWRKINQYEIIGKF